ncbi:hypothetical protein TI39_contig4585g00001 [Zymoseptoria brevis]|uniref:Uncharacterized protein n=1 Tax=Zymoseptoria brevis TaxID=1047168 RepID=A0A0F4G6B5_9PEZI|nr:hypothetical protein TI39_contig4585g00001 [Zymoseptoria brevis]
MQLHYLILAAATMIAAAKAEEYHYMNCPNPSEDQAEIVCTDAGGQVISYEGRTCCVKGAGYELYKTYCNYRPGTWAEFSNACGPF